MCDLNHMIYHTLSYVDYISQIVFKIRKGYLETPTIRLIINTEFNPTLPFHAPMTAEAIDFRLRLRLNLFDPKYEKLQ